MNFGPDEEGDRLTMWAAVWLRSAAVGLTPCATDRERLGRWTAIRDNGILVEVPGEFVSAGSNGMPDLASATEPTMSAEIDASWAGRVRVSSRLELSMEMVRV